MHVRRNLGKLLLAFVLLMCVVGIAATITFGTFAVAIPESLKGDDPGTLVAVEQTGRYPGFVAQYLLNSVDLPDPIDVKYGVTLYRVKYRTTNYDGSAVVASGLLALPNGCDLHSVVVYHHGTIAERLAAPSQSRLGEGTLVAVATSGIGHVLVAPDYIGLGESHTTHPYLHTKTTASTSTDFLRAARTLVEHLRVKWPSSLYLMGFSQGGHATFAVHRDLEKLHDPRFEVRASAAIAGPFHLREVSFPHALTGKSKAHAFYLAYTSNSYAHTYSQPLKSIMISPYAETVPVLFDGDHKTDEILAALPNDPRKLFNLEFLAAYDKGESHWFLDALAENNVDAWTPAAPVRIYYGEDDEDVPPEEARRLEAAMKRRGADVTAISVGDCKHDASARHAIPKAIRWFTELQTAKLAMP